MNGNENTFGLCGWDKHAILPLRTLFIELKLRKYPKPSHRPCKFMHLKGGMHYIDIFVYHKIVFLIDSISKQDQRPQLL